jgi:hypothetical protein
VQYGVCLNQHCAAPCLASVAGIDLARSPDCYDCIATRCGDPSADVRCGACDPTCAMPDWSCLGHVEWPAPRAIALPVDYGVQAFDIASPSLPAGGGTVRFCSGQFCEPPIAGPFPANAEGRATLTIERTQNFAKALFEYWEYSAPGFVPTLNWMTPPPVREGVDTRGVLSDSYLAVLTELGFDTPTGASGLANAFNVEPGVVRLRTKRVSTGEVVSDLPVIVRAGWATFFSLMPTPVR